MVSLQKSKNLHVFQSHASSVIFMRNGKVANCIFLRSKLGIEVCFKLFNKNICKALEITHECSHTSHETVLFPFGTLTHIKDISIWV